MKKCIVCGGDFYSEPLISYKNMPASAQNIPSKKELNSDKGIELNIYQCSCCELIQTDCEAVYYYKDVIRSGGNTSSMINIRKNQYSEFVKKFNLFGKRILEVGCGQGEFLQILTEFDVHAFGIENNDAFVLLAQKKGLSVTKNFIGNKTDIVSNEKFDAFLSFNFLEHQPNPNGMLQGIYNNLADNAVGIITVPSFEYIVERNSFYEFIRDHLMYFTEETLKFLLIKNGFSVLECSRLNNDTISVFVQKNTKANLINLKDNFVKLNSSIKTYVGKIKNQNGVIAVWGASHQCFTILSTAELGNYIDYIIDSAVFKQGKYSPATHVPIVSPDYFFEKRADSIIIIAPGYYEEIYDIIKEKYGADIGIAVLRGNDLEILV